jgi:radical SAM superfamily enzyme YgiQ (UPF0313 family)
MKLAYVNAMHDQHRLYSTVYISQPPVSLGTLAAVTPPGIETTLIDEQTDRLRFDADAFAFTVTTQIAAKIYRLADGLRRDGKRVILGGHHVTVRPDEAAAHADAVVTGEAETIWPTVCDDLLSHRLRQRYNGTPTPPEAMRAVDYRFFGRRRYNMPASVYATRGCPYACSFCLSSKLMGGYRLKPMAVIAQEIDQLAQLWPSKPVQFTDDCLFANPAFTAELLDMMKRKGRRFVCQLTVDQLCDRELVDQIVDAGCQIVAAGVESVDADNCQFVHKDQNVDQPVKQAVEHAASRGLHVCALLIVGLPHDTPQRLEGTIRHLRSIPFSGYDISILRVWPGTTLFDEMRDQGNVQDHWWLNDSGNPTNHVLPGYLNVNYVHPHFDAPELQQWALDVTDRLNRVDADIIRRMMSVGRRRRAPVLAARGVLVRSWIARTARKWKRSVESATPPVRACA